VVAAIPCSAKTTFSTCFETTQQECQASSLLLRPLHHNSRCWQAQSADTEASPSSNIKTRFHRQF
jgi:hypothetical protein